MGERDVRSLARFRARRFDLDKSAAMLAFYRAMRVAGIDRWTAYRRAFLDVWQSITRQADARR